MSTDQKLHYYRRSGRCCDRGLKLRMLGARRRSGLREEEDASVAV